MKLKSRLIISRPPTEAEKGRAALKKMGDSVDELNTYLTRINDLMGNVNNRISPVNYISSSTNFSLVNCNLILR